MFGTMAGLAPDELLTTTRAVRRRLDLSRPVERTLIEECVAIASQAPNAGNKQRLHFVMVADHERRSSLAQIYRKCSESYFAFGGVPAAQISGDPIWDAAMKRKFESERHLYEHLHEVPVHVIPCIAGRTDGLGVAAQAGRWGSVFPAVWSFMLAGRARGLGMTFTTIHLNREEEVAKLLGIPFGEVMQAGLLPVAYSKGSRFRPGLRAPVSEMLHWDGW
jgi:nitroreductase